VTQFSALVAAILSSVPVKGRASDNEKRSRNVIVGILHHGIVISDIEQAVAWYRDVLGLELVHRQRGENAYTPILVGVPGAVLEVAQFRVSNELPRASTHDLELIQYVRQGVDGALPPVNQVGAAHLAFLVSDIQALYDRATRGGAQFRNPPTRITEGANEGGYGSYLHDPDGNTLEFIQPAPARLEALLTRVL
jgi:lactoylglutathione lyase